MYIDRTEAGKITGAYARQQREGQEWIADDASELLEYLNPTVSVEDQKRAAYRTEADPLYLEWQALKELSHQDAAAKKTEWMNKRAEIQARFV